MCWLLFYWRAILMQPHMQEVVSILAWLMSLTCSKLYCISVTHSQYHKTIVWPNDWLAQPVWHLLRQAPNMLHLVTDQFPIWTSFQRFYISYFLHASSPTSHRHELQPVPVSIPPPPFHRNIHSSHFRQYSPLLWLWHLTVESYTIIISLQSYLLSYFLLLVFHHPLILSL